MVGPDQLARLVCSGYSHKRWSIQLRGYLKADKGGIFNPERARDLATYLNHLADEADARNGTNLEGTSGVPYGEDEGTTEAAGL